MIHHGGSDKFYMSEEMIGAYLEGKLSPHDARYVESLMERDADIASLVDDCKAYSEIFHQYDYHDGISFIGTEDLVPDIDDSFSLPEIPGNVIETNLDPILNKDGNLDIGQFGVDIENFDFFFFDSEGSIFD